MALLHAGDGDCPLAGEQPLEHRRAGRIRHSGHAPAVVGGGHRGPRRSLDVQRDARAAKAI